MFGFVQKFADTAVAAIDTFQYRALNLRILYMVDSPQKGQPFVRGDLLAVAQVDDQVYLFRTDTGCAALITVTGTVQVFQFLIQLVRIHVVTVFSLFLIVLKSAGTVGPGSPPLFHTLVPANVEAFSLPAIAPEPVAFIGGCWRVP